MAVTLHRNKRSWKGTSSSARSVPLMVIDGWIEHEMNALRLLLPPCSVTTSSSPYWKKREEEEREQEEEGGGGRRREEEEVAGQTTMGVTLPGRRI